MYLCIYVSVYLLYIYIYIYMYTYLYLYLLSISFYLFRAVVPGVAYERHLTTYGHFRIRYHRTYDSGASIFVLKASQPRS